MAGLYVGLVEHRGYSALGRREETSQASPDQLALGRLYGRLFAALAL